MGIRTKIDWTESTWNPVRGCTKVSPGCQNCYAEALMERFRGVRGHPFEGGFRFRLVPGKLDEPLTWRTPRTVFVCSVSDLFHERVPDEYIARVFETMVRADWHVFQVLTKRSDRLAEMSDDLPWPRNIWAGVSVESSDYAHRIVDLLEVPATVRFVSAEPLLGPLAEVSLNKVDWVIVGGESGPRARPMELAWARGVRDQCSAAGVPFFLKQLGGRRGKRAGALAVLDGRRWTQMPVPSARCKGVCLSVATERGSDGRWRGAAIHTLAS